MNEMVMRERPWLKRVSLAIAVALLCPLATAAFANDRVYFFHNDHLGTPQAMTDLAGRTVWTAEYEPFGNATVNQDPDGDGHQVVNNLRFPGHYYDAETGLHYNYHRDYDPETGRYLQPDPIGLKGGTNLYAYASGNPTKFTDRKGQRIDFHNCSQDKLMPIALAIQGAKAAAEKCLDCEEKEEFKKIANNMTYSCYPYETGPGGNPDCGFSYAGQSKDIPMVIYLTPLCFDGSCGCMESVIFHEVLHFPRLSYSEDRAWAKTRQCVNCAK